MGKVLSNIHYLHCEISDPFYPYIYYMNRFYIDLTATVAVITMLFTLSSFKHFGRQDGCWRKVIGDSRTLDESNSPVNPNSTNQCYDISDITLSQCDTGSIFVPDESSCPAPFEEHCCYRLNKNKIIEVVYGMYDQ